jgi:hypothetical protein
MIEAAIQNHNRIEEDLLSFRNNTLITVKEEIDSQLEHNQLTLSNI